MVASRKRSLAYITDESRRQFTFKKRKASVFKKASELSTLCGIPTCVVLYSPDEPNPEVWPNPHEANEILARFNAMSDEKKKTKMTDSDKMLRKEIEKKRQELFKVQLENHHLELRILLSRLLKGDIRVRDLQVDDVGDLMKVVDWQIKKIQERKEGIKSAESAKREVGASCESSKKEVVSLESLVTDSGEVEVADGPTCMQLFPMTAIRDELEDEKKKKKKEAMNGVIG